VPYSGYIAPDGHSDHVGAWPTDLYYVTPTSDWSDNTVNQTNSSRPQNLNTIGDGKFDQSTINSDLFCSISRVDFYNLSKSPDSELVMMQGYLNKASAYKRGNVNYIDQGIIEDNFASFSEGFAGNGYGNFISLCDSGVVTSDVLTGLSSSTYKWSYACGGGSDTSMNGFGSVTDLHQTDYQGVFSMLFGSYLGDWNTTDNLMRSALANGKMLTTAWAGRPNWFFHHMGMNNPIGYSAKLSIENSSNTGSPLYDTEGYYGNGIHMELLGDPTLRSEYMPVVADFLALENSAGTQVDLSWTLPVTDITAIRLYKYDSASAKYVLKVNLTGLDTAYTDAGGSATDKYYVSYTKLQNTITGSYVNNATGSFTEAVSVSALPVSLIRFTGTVVDEHGLLEWSTAQELNFSHFELQKKDFNKNWEPIANINGNHNTSQISDYSFIDGGLHMGVNTYRLKMIDFDGSIEYSNEVSLNKQDTETELSIYPNPSIEGNVVTLVSKRPLEASEVKISDMLGRSYDFNLEGNRLHHDLSPGEYVIQYQGQNVKWILL
jgi:hypothetical protein